MDILEITGLSKRYRIDGREVVAVDTLDLRVEQGSFVTVVGRSGCGKTTLLRLLSGLESADAGTIRFSFRIPGGPAAAPVGMVFQEPRLMPWLTVRQNMAFGLHREGDRRAVEDRIDRFLGLLGLTAFQNAYPSQISGGMAQRTALGRTLCLDPEIILMDEPFGALDAFTRRNLQQELVEIYRSGRKTILFVTHDVDEAVLLGQRILVMEQGAMVGDAAVAAPYPRNPLDRDLLCIREEILKTIFRQ